MVRRRRGAVASRRSDQFEYRGRWPLLRVAPFLRAAEDGEDCEDLDAGQVLRGDRPHKLFHLADCGVAKQHVGHRVDGDAIAIL